MKIETLVEMMEQEEYQVLTCGEFAKLVRDSGVIEMESMEGNKKSVGNELDFLTDPEWQPTSVTHHTNRDK